MRKIYSLKVHFIKEERLTVESKIQLQNEGKAYNIQNKEEGRNNIDGIRS